MPNDDDDLSSGELPDDPPEEEEELEDPEPAVSQPAPANPPRRLPSPRRPGTGSPGKPKMTPAGTPNTRFQFKEAELLWGEVLAFLRLNHKTPHDVTVQVFRVDPPPSMTLMPNFDGSIVAGSANESPDDQLVRRVADYYHLPTARQAATYSIRFLWKANGMRIAQGNLTLPPPAEIIAGRNAAMRMQHDGGEQGVGSGRQFTPGNQGGGGGYGGGGYGGVYQPPPPQQPWQQTPPYQPQGVGGVDPNIQAMMGELSYLRGAFSEALSAAREGRQPNIQPPPPGVAAPPISEDAIVDKVVAKLGILLGHVGAAAPPAAAPAPQPAAQVTHSLTGMVEKMVTGVLETSIKAVMGGVERQVKVATGMGGVPAEEPEADEPPPPEDPVPWNVAPVSDVKWPDGSPVRYASDKESKDISPMGLAFSNPYVAEKAMDMLGGLAEAVKKVVSEAAANAGAGMVPRVGAGSTPAQVVDRIPPGAQNGTPPGESGGGWPSV
jgi:hypothetical protein